MNEKPILFSGEMIRQILNGNKSQTRRVIKPRKSYGEIVDIFDTDDLETHGFIGVDTTIGHNIGVHCPFGRIGSKLWVRETWADVTNAFDDADEIRTVAFRADSSVYDVYGQVRYLEQLGVSGIEVNKWKPSIFMPKYASRISLEILSISVEQIQEISHSDVSAEGFTDKNSLISTWNVLNEKRGFGWEKNPFCWVINFTKKNI